MTLIENMVFIRHSIKSLECPMKVPTGVTKAYKEVFKRFLDHKDSNFYGEGIKEESLQREFEEDFMPYYDRFKEEEEGVIDGRYPKKRVGFKV